jgi:hypothetical protein
MKYMYKFLNQKGKTIVSEHGNQKWTIGEWLHVDGNMECCENGLHASKTIYNAFSYVQGSVLAKVEVKGKHDDQDDKSAYSDMRIVEAYKWAKKDSVALSIFVAEMCLKEFEKLYPDDKRPRKAIDAARAVLAHDTANNRSAAYAASSAAYAASYAAYAAHAFSYAAYAAYAASAAASYAASAAYAAYAASAAYAAYAASAASAAASAASAAASVAARSAVIKKLDKWLEDHVKELEEL